MMKFDYLNFKESKICSKKENLKLKLPRGVFLLTLKSYKIVSKDVGNLL